MDCLLVTSQDQDCVSVGSEDHGRQVFMESHTALGKAVLGLGLDPLSVPPPCVSLLYLTSFWSLVPNNTYMGPTCQVGSAGSCQTFAYTC